MSSIQPCLALWQRERQGGIEVAKFFDTKQYGAYTEHRKWAKSLEQPTFTKGVNWDSSRAASCCDVWFNMFGNIVLLYWKPWQSGIVRGSQTPWACEGNNILSAKTTPSITFELITVGNISTLWTVVVSSETLSEGERTFICAQFVTRVSHMPIKACLISPSKRLEMSMSGVGAKFFFVPTLHGIQKLASSSLFARCKIVWNYYGSCQPMESPLEEFQSKDRAPELLEKETFLFFLLFPKNKK